MEDDTVHYNEGQWSDFVRGLADAALAREMETHLATDCRVCQSLVQSLRAVERTAQEDRRRPVPREVFLRAVAVFRPERRLSLADLPRRLAEIVFDSFEQPLALGVRSLEPQVRRMVFESGTLRTEVHLELGAPKRMMVVTGQLSALPENLGAISGMRVALLDGQSTLTEGQANEFGEFQIECPMTPGLQLVAWSPQGDESVVMDLSGPTGSRGKGGPQPDERPH